MKTKIAIIGDVHLSDVQVTTRLDNYNEAILAKLEFIRDYCNQNDIEEMFFLGDLFHRKSAQQTTHQTIARLITLFESFDARVWTIIGNHDYNGSIDSFDKQPLNVLHTCGALNILDENMTEGVEVTVGTQRKIKVLDRKSVV